LKKQDFSFMFFDGGNRAYYEILATNFSQFFYSYKNFGSVFPPRSFIQLQNLVQAAQNNTVFSLTYFMRR